MKVKITHNARGRGKLVVQFRNHEEFEQLKKQVCGVGARYEKSEARNPKSEFSNFGFRTSDFELRISRLPSLPVLLAISPESANIGNIRGVAQSG